ncbi:hypothetical protein QQG09_09195 [Melissococcus plutonius]|uniref:Uncharacterized protein n=1 Tax=Melissococcus plutonius TaxID=33970 RepID=A0A2Z5Y4Y3_9ENTE|nr:hypothetical protein [Melissococcus plutonius]KMT26966.1 hypothetical protein MEPL4_8c00010 [Melissococcus plutonius]KMT29099.1 hypothetical protein MEPL7_19p00070 [Melissococcus plutonius]KMT33549.1 hypothetical protein MEPL9_11c00020 [Melissococcus plutonius]KMT37790.1 hypothetical protein MEPL11_10c00010 [Melissococcus plutonius]MCV2499637.1 hypothetical protein [Melissococcus plutonius]
MTTRKEEGIAITMKGFPYLVFDGKNFEKVVAFCSPHKVRKTKKFNTTKKVAIDFPTGNRSIQPNEILVKVTEGEYLILSRTVFDFLFFDA